MRLRDKLLFPQTFMFKAKQQQKKRAVTLSELKPLYLRIIKVTIKLFYTN